MGYTLIANIDFVQLNRCRVDCHALLISPFKEPSLARGGTLRGFGVDGADDRFTIWFEEKEPSFELVDASDPSKIILGDSGVARPIFSGGLLKIQGWEIFIQVDDHRQPIDVLSFEEEADITEVWGKLPSLVARYWCAPNMPVRKYVPAESVRRGIYGLATQ